MWLFGQKKNIDQLSDAELIAQFRKSHNAQILGELFKRYNHLVFGISLKYLKNEDEAKDAMMQIYEELFNDLKHHQIQNFKSWLHSKTRNFCLMKIRKQSTISKKQNVYEHSFSQDDAYDNFWEEDEHNTIEKQLTDLEIAIELLKDEQKECIKLFYLKQKSYADIVQITGYNLKKVKSYIQNGKRNLKKLMETRINEG
ncbi:MAG TPA: RNA polymerase subunit sigma-70 [Flavobacteriales bacterium]|nr:RNA polymerase subunit sigma-70 [Flavobacteriales bacterium]|tara:strand:- start:33 stop:629 length:597 start_codon:yes stop_codon:yes gene_type:complete